MSNFQMSDYVDVAARLVEFREKHPGGSLQPADLANPFTVQMIGDQTFIVVVAAAYRSPDDPKPGIGMAYEVFPGRTPYTRGSELQNAETSAWGRAIVAALAADTKKGVASAEEVRNRVAERENSASDDKVRAAQDEVIQAGSGLGWEPKKILQVYAEENGGRDLRQVTDLKVINAFRDDLLSRITDEPAGLKAVA